MTRRVERHSRFARFCAATLLRLYPPAVRARFGSDMARDFLDTYASRRTGGERMRFLIAAIGDTLRSATAERREARSDVFGSDLQPARRATMYGLIEDVRFGLRSLRARPAFVAAVVLTLALGIGANTAVFSMINAIFIRPVAIVNPSRVVTIFQVMSSKQRDGLTFYPVFAGLRKESKTLAGVAALSSNRTTVKGPAGVETLVATVVSGSYFDVLGVRPFIGRLISREDDGAHGASPVIVISYRLWQRWFGADQQMLGKTVTMDNRAFTIIGVAPASFRGNSLATTTDFWAPLSMVTSLGIGTFYKPQYEHTLFAEHQLPWLTIVARKRAGIADAAVDAEINHIVAHIPHSFRLFGDTAAEPRSPLWTMPITQSAALRDRDALVRFVRLMFAVVVLTLLLACANVGNLLLVRSSERAQELAVRAALGAGRARIVRQLFIESAMLALLGAAVGLGFAVATVRALSAFTLPGSIALSELDLSLDGRVLWFTAAVAVGTAIAFGLLPALRASRVDVAAFLRNDRGSKAGTSIRNVLVAVQVALALTLLIGATLFARSLRAGLTTDLGFDPHGLAAVNVDLRTQGYDKPRMAEYFRDAERRLRGHPEIERVGIALHVPLAPATSLPMSSSDATTPSGAQSTRVITNSVSNDYFATLGVPILRGRMFNDAEAAGTETVAIVNEAAARAFWGRDDPIGRSLTMLMSNRRYTVVGVVKTTKYSSMADDDEAAVFYPLLQETGFGGVSVLVRSRTPASALHVIERELGAIDAGVALRKPRLVGDQMDDVLMPQRFGSRLFGIFSSIALVIAAIGVHGVVAYGVSLRRRELGIRIALGARSVHIYWTVLRGSLLAVAFGGIIGLGAGALGSPALAAFLYGIHPLDAAAFAGATAALTIVAVGATVIPARRASRTDPVASMRSE
jgi:predicted permease